LETRGRKKSIVDKLLMKNLIICTGHEIILGVKKSTFMEWTDINDIRKAYKINFSPKSCMEEITHETWAYVDAYCLKCIFKE
jgi:hypothetical protein